MEIETLKRDNRKKWIIISVVVIILASVIFFVATRANYKVTQKVNIANGTINYSPSDLNLMAIKLQNSSGGYDNASSVPTSGYTLSSSSYCEVNGTKDTSITMEYKDGKVYIPINTKNTKCYLYFDIKVYAKEAILSGLTKLERTSFTTALTENTTGKIYKAQDDDGETYYFAGEVDNNWVKFGGFYWRIVRINGDGTIRLIYSGTSASQTGSTIGTGQFNSNADYSVYVGYMYGTKSSTNYAGTHSNLYSSNALSTLASWYSSNLNKDGIKEYISIDAGFCNDRSLYNGTGVGTSFTEYNGSYRVISNKKPSFKCTNSNDLFTGKGASKGNKALTYPVGLITADEVIYAGGGNVSSNESIYLKTDKNVWTMTPRISVDASFITMLSNGNISYSTADTVYYGFRPVINLKADTIFKAGTDGTTSKPYEVA